MVELTRGSASIPRVKAGGSGVCRGNLEHGGVEMTWEFLIVVIVVVLVPGVDLLMVLRNTVAGGQSVGAATIAGVGVASTFQGTLVAVGVGALVVQSQWLFQAING
jgi:threonine/homoserine/homoserine lactone efflux protein